MIPEEIRPQLDELVAGMESALGDDIVGIYLHGSTALAELGPWSDIDLVVVVERPLNAEAKRELAELVMSVSDGYKRGGPLRPVELDVLLAAALTTWRHPAAFEFHYSESLRERFEVGELEPWAARTNRDLAAHVVVLREHGVAVFGPPPRELFPAIPGDDFRDALVYEIELWTDDSDVWRIPGAIRNMVLSRARAWATLSTGRQHSKVSGADWAMTRLAAELRPVLEHALELHTGVAETERWRELRLEDYFAVTKAEIDVLAAGDLQN